MKNVHCGLCVKNMSDLVLKETYGKYGRKNLTKNEAKKYKMTEREVSEKYDNLIENKLNKKSNKKAHVRNDVITNVIVHCRGGKKGGERRRGEFRKKLKIPEYEISQCAEYKIKSKIGKIFVDKKTLEEYCVKFYEINFCFYEHCEEK